MNLNFPQIKKGKLTERDLKPNAIADAVFAVVMGLLGAAMLLHGLLS